MNRYATALFLLILVAINVYSGSRAAEAAKRLEAQRGQLQEIQHQIEQLEAEKKDIGERLQQRITELGQLQEITSQLEEEAQAMKEILQWETQTMETTFYAPLDPTAIPGVCFSGDPRITASGQAVEIGTTAAAPWDLPYNTRLYIPGFGFRIVQDRGGDITAGRLDIAVQSKKEAFQLGRQQLTVYIAGKD